MTPPPTALALHTAAPVRRRSPSLTAARIGDYQLEYKVGENSLSESYVGTIYPHRSFPRRAILSLLRPRHRSNPDAFKLFAEQAWLASAVDHHNLLRVNDADVCAVAPVVATRYFEGISLRDLLTLMSGGPRTLPLDSALRIAVSACRAVHYLHGFDGGSGRRKGWVHGRLSPRNIRISNQGHIKIVNVSFVPQMGLSDPTTHEATADGTTYLAPELFQGDRTSTGSDIYALGTLLRELMMESVAGVDESTTAVSDSCPKELAEIVASATADDPADRYQSAREIETAIEDLVPVVDSADCRMQLADLAQSVTSPTPRPFHVEKALDWADTVRIRTSPLHAHG